MRRNAALANFFVTDWWDNGGNQIAFGRGDKGFVVINREATGLTRTFTTSLPAGRYCDVLSGDFTAAAGTTAATCSGTVVTVDALGNASITAPAFSAAAIHSDARLDATTPGTVSVTFNEAADTNFGQNVYVTGSIAELASWNPANANPLSRISGSGR